jgi:hypothetical protein
MQLYRYFVSQSGEHCRHNTFYCFSTSVYCLCCLFLYRLSPETFGYTHVHVTANRVTSNEELCPWGLWSEDGGSNVLRNISYPTTHHLHGVKWRWRQHGSPKHFVPHHITIRGHNPERRDLNFLSPWKPKTMKHFVMSFPQSSCYFLCLVSKYTPQHFVLYHLQTMSSLRVETKFHTHTKLHTREFPSAYRYIVINCTDNIECIPRYCSR